MSNCNWCSVQCCAKEMQTKFGRNQQNYANFGNQISNFREILKVVFCSVLFDSSFFRLLIIEWTGLSLVLKRTMSQGCMLLFLVNYVPTAKFSQKQILTKFPNLILWNFEKEITFCESTGRYLSHSPSKTPSSTLVVKGLSHKYSLLEI